MNVYGPPDLRELLVIDEERGVGGGGGSGATLLTIKNLCCTRPNPGRRLLALIRGGSCNFVVNFELLAVGCLRI
jgi:hypothetical protein